MYPNKTDPIKTGEYISLLRKDRGMTQFDLAAGLQVSHQAVSKWETGNALPDIDMLLAIANLFEINIDDLIFGDSVSENQVPDDKRHYSETMACTIKTNDNVTLLLEAYEEMLEDDITDCIQTLDISDDDVLLTLCTRLSSHKIAQFIKTLDLCAFLPSIADKMDKVDIIDCIQTLDIHDAEILSKIKIMK